MSTPADVHNAPGQYAPEQQQQPYGPGVEMTTAPQHANSSYSVPQHPGQQPDAMRAHDGGPTDLPPAYPAGGQKGPAPQGQPGAGPVPLGQLRHDGQIIDCPWCQKRATARMTEDGQGMQIVTGILIGCFCICLACLPCCLNWFVERTWTCSECGHKVATASEGDDNPTVPVTPQAGYAPGQGPPPPQQQQQQQYHQQQPYDQQQQHVQQQQPVQEPPMAHGK